MKIEGIKFVLWVQDMQRAIRFYKGVFSLTVGYASPVWTELRYGETVIALHNGGGGTDTPTGLSIHVDNIYDACGQVRDAGGEIVEAPHARPGESIRLARVTDTEGNEFTLTARNG